MRVGFVGIGSQGAPMAARIGLAGFDLTVWARRPEAYATLGTAPHRVAPSLAAVADGADLVCVCVLADDDVESVCLGDEGLLAGLRTGSVLAVHSTIRPATVVRVAEAAARGGVDVLDAPVSGGSPAAAAGQLLTMVGGDAAVLDRVRPVLAAHSHKIVHLGAVGTGQLAKVLNNGLFTAQLALVDAALTAGVGLGLDHDRLVEVLTGSSGRSFALEMLARVPDRRAMAGALVGLLGKDVGILEEAGGAERGAAEIVRTARLFWE